MSSWVLLSVLAAVVLASLTYFGISRVRTVFHSSARKLRFVAMLFSIVTFLVTLLVALNPLAMIIPVMFSIYAYIAALYASQGRVREMRSLVPLLIILSIAAIAIPLTVFRSVTMAIIMVPEILSAALLYDVCLKIAENEYRYKVSA